MAKKAKKTREYFIAHVGNIIWGIGLTEKSALRDGKHWINDYNRQGYTENKNLLKVIPATRSLYDGVNNYGGGQVDWKKSRGIAKLVE